MQRKLKKDLKRINDFLTLRLWAEGHLIAGIEDEVRVRDFRKPDLASALKVVQLSFVEEFELKGFDPRHIEKLANQMFGVPGRILLGLLKTLGKEFLRAFAAEVGDQVVGTTIVTKQRKVAYISTVAVHPFFRRRGVARRLLKRALEYVRNQGLKRAVLHVISTNSPAKALYVGLGFRDFEKVVLVAADVEWVSPPEPVKGIEIDDFRKSQTDTVHELLRFSEDPGRLDVFDYEKDDLQTTFFERVFHLYSKEQMVASCGGRIIGYLESTHTTPEEAGQINNVQVHPEFKGKGIEEMLIHAAVSKIASAGTKKIVGTVSARKPELIAAMEKLGFERHLELNGMVVELQ
jgi:ribosomal protein S18 acetylase RimI-like enzyme